METPHSAHRRRYRAQQLELRSSTLWKILRKNLGLRTYKMQLVQEWKPNDHHARRTYGEWTQKEMTTDADFYKKTLFKVR